MMIMHHNSLCECPAAGFCKRHGVEKSTREHQLCQGVACTVSQSKKYWKAWEEGTQPGQTAPVEQPIEFVGVGWDATMPSRGLGDVIAKFTNSFGIRPCNGCKGRQSKLNSWFPFKHNESNPTPEFVTYAKLVQDIQRLVSALPVATSRIVGVSRSGLKVAGMVAEVLHRPLSIFRQTPYGDMIDAGNGWRLTGHVNDTGPVVVIDDTVMSGNSFKHVMPIIRREYPTALSAAVYVNPAAHTKPDIWVRDLPWPHLLEWNLFNSIMSPHVAVDFDGIICWDFEHGNEEGERYETFLRDVRPLYYMRKVPIPLIVTARLEKYRGLTQTWLARHGYSVRNLVMGPWRTHAERSRADVAQFKADHFKRFMLQTHRIQPPMFIESDEHQAKRIAEISGGIVVCPAAGRCFP